MYTKWLAASMDPNFYTAAMAPLLNPNMYMKWMAAPLDPAAFCKCWHGSPEPQHVHELGDGSSWLPPT
jgi:hypothetical protein